MAEIKSFRISDETKERLEELSTAIGGNKDRVFNALMDSYALQQEKNTLTDQAKSVELFEQYANTLVRLYLEALRAVSSSDDRIRGEFHNQLEENARTVSELRKERDKAERELENARKAEAEWGRERRQLQTQIAALEKALAASEEQAKAKQAMNDALLLQVQAASAVQKECKELKERCEVLKSNLEEEQILRLKSKQDAEEIRRTAQAEKEKASYEAEMDKKDAVSQAVDALRVQKDAELIEQRNQALTLQNELQAAKTELLSLRLELSARYQQDIDALRTEKDQKIQELQTELLKIYAAK